VNRTYLVPLIAIVAAITLFGVTQVRGEILYFKGFDEKEPYIPVFGVNDKYVVANLLPNFEKSTYFEAMVRELNLPGNQVLWVGSGRSGRSRGDNEICVRRFELREIGAGEVGWDGTPGPGKGYFPVYFTDEEIAVIARYMTEYFRSL